MLYVFCRILNHSRAASWRRGDARVRWWSSKKLRVRYVKSLNIDPIREADMLWIAEEVLPTPLKRAFQCFSNPFDAFHRLKLNSPGFQCSSATWVD